ncbi:HAD-IA family hydrolase [Pseudoflavitalea sp. X16]|uniref:HAD-IA family hydrolase n=1 Tax=Paraflavitalea devenefica TaxID=2716334 RepID=UPI00141DBC29|nr:HAD-IA family hydrolase [Paraflavitalea devenefica]NII23897.1 HAD-IA family hydrolase [Paraflavitalea devenefica]
MAIQLVVFDIAGTTVRDKGSVADAFMAAAAQYGVSVPREEVNKVMGFRKKEAIRILLDKFYLEQDDTEGLIEKIHDAFTHNMISFYKQDAELAALPHAEETFAWLKQRGIKIALNTGFTRNITDTILQRLQWKSNGMIDMVITSDEVPEGRPKPYMIAAIMKQLDIADAGQVAKVGDTEVDVEEGRNAGCGLVVGVTTGAYTRSELEQYKPDTIIDSLAELPPLIQ